MSFSAGGLDGAGDASDVTHSSAFHILNTLVEEGVILDERANYLKAKFTELHSRVLTIYKRDNTLLKRARQLRADLDHERERVRSRGDVAKKDDAEINQLKQRLIDLEKELNEAQERESVLQVEVLEYDRRKQTLILEREDALAAEEGRLRPKMESVQADIASMGAAIKELVQQQESLQTQQSQLEKEEVDCKKEIALFTTTLTHARQQLTNVEHEPDRATKQLQLVCRSLGAAEIELTAAENKAASLTEAIGKLELQRSSRTADAAAVAANLQKLKEEINAKRKTLAALSTSLEMELEGRQGFQDRLNELEQLIKTTRISSKQESDGVERIQREKTRCMKEFSSLEQARENLEREQQSLQEQLNTTQKECTQLEAARQKIKSKTAEAKKIIEARTRQLLREQAKEKAFTEKAALALSDLGDASDLATQKTLQEEVKRRELLALASRQKEVNRGCAKEVSRATLAKNELSSKSLQLRELKHRHQELEKRLASMLENFQNIKRERSHKTSLIQAISQKMTEVNEKTKILENELEVLVREAAVKEQELVKRKRATHEAQQVVAQLRLEKNKQRKKSEMAQHAEKEVRAQVKRLNLDVAAVEDTMTALKDEYATAVESRNHTGIQLIDRNDTLSLLVEKAKAQEKAVEQGTSMTNARAEEAKRLRVELADLLRSIEVCQRSVPKVKQLEDELEKINAEIDDERWRMEVLENELTDPSNPSRWRQLDAQAGSERVGPATTVSSSKLAGENSPGSTAAATNSGAQRPAPGATSTATGGALPTEASGGVPSEEYVRLQARTQDLESRLNAINAKLREKELILSEVSELSDRIGSQAESGRELTLSLAKRVNQFQGGIRGKTRQLMASISELSLFQASSVQLQQEVERLEGIVADAEQRLASGEAPFAEAEEEYQRQKGSNDRYAELLQRQRLERSSGATGVLGPNTIVTTAEPRPNAYVPDDGQLALPRPFGAHAPFKPRVGPVRGAAVGSGATIARTGQGWGEREDVPLTRSLAATGPAAGQSPGALSAPVAASTAQASASARSPAAWKGDGSGTADAPSRSGRWTDAASPFSSSLPASRRLWQQVDGSQTDGDRDRVSGTPPPSGNSAQLRLSQRNGSSPQ